MAFLLPHRSKKYIRENYNAWGLLCLVVPVYIRLDYVPEIDAHCITIGGDGGDGGFMPPIEEMNWVPKSVFWLGSVLMGMWIYAQAPYNPRPLLPLLIMGDIDED